MEVRGELLRAEGSVLPPCGAWRPNSGCCTCWQVPLPPEHLASPRKHFFNDLFDLKFCAHELRDQKRVSYPLELKLQVVISLLTWVLGAKFDSSGRAEKVLLTVSLAPLPTLSKLCEV